jgi:hypothetical protein
MLRCGNIGSNIYIIYLFTVYLIMGLIALDNMASEICTGKNLEFREQPRRISIGKADLQIEI